MVDWQNKGYHHGRGSEKTPPQTGIRYDYKINGEGETLQELKNVCPGVYLNGFNDPDCYYFSGSGTALRALEQATPLRLTR